MSFILKIVSGAAWLASSVSCDTEREDGHVEVTLVDVTASAKTLLVGLAALDSKPVAFSDDLVVSKRLTGDEIAEGKVVSFLDVKAGVYRVWAGQLDKDGSVVEEGVSEVIEVVSEQIRSVSILMVYVDPDDACSPLDNRCGFYPGIDLVLTCGEDGLWHPSESCGATGGCQNGACRIDGPSISVPCADGDASGTTELSLDVCNPTKAGRFTTEITHPYFPLVVGNERVLQGPDDEDANLRVTRTVLDEVEEIDGVFTRVVAELEEAVAPGGTYPQQRSRAYFAEAEDGTVCFFGEDVWLYDGDDETLSETSWRADSQSNRFPGIMMPAEPAVGMTFQQQLAPMVALDRGYIIAMGREVRIDDDVTDDTVWVEESSPLDEDKSMKVYVKDIGLVQDEALKLVEIDDM